MDPVAHRHLLLHRIGRRYQVVTEAVEFGTLRFQFTRIADPDRVLDEVAAESDLRDRLHGRQADGDQLHLPYWAELWDSTRGIGFHLVALAQSGGGKLPLNDLNASPLKMTGCEIPEILDLGCGMGMAGTVAAALGAKVMFADLESPALLFARLNSLRWRSRVQTRRLNWQRDRLFRRFNLILGADILYEKSQWPYLESFWRAHLAQGGSIVLGEPGRQTGDLFIDWIASIGWHFSISDIPVETRPRPIRIFTIRPNS